MEIIEREQFLKNNNENVNIIVCGDIPRRMRCLLMWHYNFITSGLIWSRVTTAGFGQLVASGGATNDSRKYPLPFSPRTLFDIIASLRQPFFPFGFFTSHEVYCG